MKTPEKADIKALIHLLETETEDYTTQLKPELCALIKHYPAQVQSAVEEDFPQNPPRVVMETMEEMCWEDLSARFTTFSGKINPDLEEGLWLLSTFIYPSLKRQDIEAPLDALAQELRPALINAANYTEIAAVMAHAFFTLHAMTALPSNLDIKDLCFARFLRKAKGSSLCMACLYACIGARFGADINAIDLAGRILVQINSKEGPLFVDPLDKGKILTEPDCRAYISARQIEWNDGFLMPLSSRLIVRRFIANMIFALNKVKDNRRLSYLRHYLEIL